MNEGKQPPNTRIRLIRDAATFQIKLMVDGIRDAILIPVSLVAALIGFLRGGDEPDREFQQVLKLGRRSERWINLFGHERSPGEDLAVGSIDQILEQAETAVIEQYKKGRPPPDQQTSGNNSQED